MDLGKKAERNRNFVRDRNFLNIGRTNFNFGGIRTLRFAVEPVYPFESCQDCACEIIEFGREALISAVTGSYGVKQDHILLRNSRDNESRQVLMYLACRFCRGRYSLTEIADRLNVSLGGLTRSRYNMRKRISLDKAARKANCQT
jgi:hypothetical protein